MDKRPLRRLGPIRAAVVLLGVCVVGGPPAATSQQTVPTRVWHLPDEGRGPADADETSAYFLTKSHEVLAVDAATGVVRWRRPTFEEGDTVSGISLLVAGQSVVVGDYNLLAFDCRTGSLRWRFIPAEGYGPGIYLGAVAGGVALTGSPSGHVYAVDVDSGALRWSTAVASNTTIYAPVAAGEVVAAGFTEFTAPTRGGVVLLSADTGRVRWKRSFPVPDDPLLSTNSAGGPVFFGETVIASGGDGRIHAFDVTSGELRWTLPRVSGASPFPMAADHDFRPLALTGNLLVAGSLTGQIVAFELPSRTERWRFLATRLGSTAFRIAAVDDVVYLPFVNGQLVALAGGDGVERWRIGDWTSGYLWPPAVRGPTLFLSGAQDGLSALSDPR
jgi:outer membrane protein assembly factor BamB